ncbi:MAG: hypothetical protein JW760_02640 [Spirochaetales bacterium]|nr:hypothetical protein [Spirochaetales bacterium]
MEDSQDAVDTTAPAQEKPDLVPETEPRVEDPLFLSVSSPETDVSPGLLAPIPQPLGIPVYPWIPPEVSQSAIPIYEIVLKDQTEEESLGETTDREPMNPRDRTVETPKTEVRSSSGTRVEPVSADRDLGTLTAPVEEPFDYTLEGEGWVFEASEPPGVRMIKRTIETGKTVFTFFRPDDRVYQVIFFFSDVMANRSERLRLSLTAPAALPEGLQEDDSSWRAASGEEREDPGKTEIPVEELVARGFYEALQAADTAEKDGEIRKALDILLLGERVYQGHRNLDRILFALASLYEHPGSLRDIPRSVAYYKKILDAFPASIFYNTARERLTYLERNFIQIR